MEEKPLDLSISLPENGGRFLFNTNVLGNQIYITSRLNITRVKFEPIDYALLRELYAQIVKKYTELIVLHKKS